MLKIKKVFVEIIDTIAAAVEAGNCAAEVLHECTTLAQAKAGGGGSAATTFHKDDEGNVLAVKCYYFGLWMSPTLVDFGAKASSTTGLNSMCKEGVSHWTKQQRVAKQEKTELLDRVAAGDVLPEDIAAEMEAIEEARDAVAPHSDKVQGFENLDDLLASLKNRRQPST